MFSTKIEEEVGGYASPEEILEGTVIIDYEKREGTGAGVTISTDGRRGIVQCDDGFYVVVGDTGSGKTTDVVLPYIYNNAICGSSMIISDVKGDIRRNIGHTLRELGYRIVYLDFDDPSRGDCFNPIGQMYRDYKNGRIGKANRGVNDLAQGIMSSIHSEKDAFWENTGADYFAGLEQTLFRYFREEDATIENALNLHLQGRKKAGSVSCLQRLYEDEQNSNQWKLLASAVTAPAETQGSIHSVFTTAINNLICQHPDLIRMLSRSTFEMEDLIKEKTVVFISANEESLSVYAYLFSALIHQWYGKLVELSDVYGGALPRRVTFVLDEFGNLPEIKDFHIKMSLSRSRNICWLLVLQSFAQLNYQYGKDKAQIIIANIKNWIYLHSPDPNLLEYISRKCGTYEDEATHRARSLLSVNQLMYFKKINKQGLTEVLMLLDRKRPFVAFLPPISEYYGYHAEDNEIPLREDPEIEPISLENVLKEKIRAKRLQEENKDMRISFEKELERSLSEAQKETAMQIAKRMDDLLNSMKGGDEDGDEDDE